MTTEAQCPISGETPEEERINFYTHLVGLFLSVVGAVALFVYSTNSPEPYHSISCAIYGVTLVSLYAASTYYHACRVTSRKYILKIIDHICIYLLIAGTYTPFALGPLRHAGGWDLLYLVWGIAAIGIAFKIVAINRFELLSVIMYVGMGWLVLYNFSALKNELSYSSLVLLFVGGASYSAGTLFYLWDRLAYNHAIWHIFVLGGSMSHYFCVLNIVQV